jgi:hypothetical protein
MAAGRRRKAFQGDEFFKKIFSSSFFIDEMSDCCFFDVFGENCIHFYRKFYLWRFMDGARGIY